MWLKQFLNSILDQIGSRIVTQLHSAYLQHQQRVRIALISLIVFLLGGFLSLLTFILLTPDFFYDIHVSKEIQEDAHPILDRIMKLLSWFGNDIVIAFTVPLTALVFYLNKYKRQAIFLLLTLLSDVIVFGIKYLVNRPRPGEDLVRVLIEADHSGFPSGHVVHYIVFFGFLIIAVFTVKELSIQIKIAVTLICLMLIAAVPFSRIYLGVHYLTDVVGGAFLGIILLIILLYFFFRNRNTNEELKNT